MKKREPKPLGFTERGHVIRLDPTCKQANALVRAVGVARFTYNWALDEWNRQYSAGKKPSAFALKKQFNAIKRDLFPWIMESPRDANSQAFTDVGRAFNNFFASRSGKRKGPKIRHPKFHKKGRNDSFYVANDQFSVRERGKRGVVRLPLIGDVRMFEKLRWCGKILSARIYRKADCWYIAIAVETVDNRPNKHQYPIVGVDLGVKTAIVTSHGEQIDAPKPLRKALKRLKRLNRCLHKKKKGSKNRNKARIKVARLHQRIANVRTDFWHKNSTKLCLENQEVVIEDLNVKAMFKNKKLARAASDVAIGMFRPMMVYKSVAYGTKLTVADRYYPSTQRCSNCGDFKIGEDKLVLGDSVYVCEKCDMVKDRDKNAALNLEQYPRLSGNWTLMSRTSMEDYTATRLAKVNRASIVVEVETKPCSLVNTN